MGYAAGMNFAGAPLLPPQHLTFLPDVEQTMGDLLPPCSEIAP